MRSKLSLNLDTLAVDSFDTTPIDADARGTVDAHSIDGPVPTPPVYADDCTCAKSCPCPTAAYYCATVHATVISCHYTNNVSCIYNTRSEC
jgi:hypothetical protein